MYVIFNIPSIAIVIKMNALKCRTLCFLLTSVKVRKFQDGDRSTRPYTAVFPKPRLFFRNPHICLQENKMLFQFRYTHRSETHAFSILSSNRQTDRLL